MDITSEVDGLYWGVIISTMMFGITIVQGWIYFNNNNDKWHLRLLVAIIIILDLATTCLNCQVLRYYLMTNFGNPLVLGMLTEGVIAGVAITAVVVYMTGIFFASRIYLLDKSNLWTPGIITLCATGALVAIALEVDDSRKDLRVAHYSLQNQTRVALGLAFIGIVDLITMVVLFRKLFKPETHNKLTRTLLQRLIVWIVTRCILVTLNQITLLIVYVTQTATFNWIPFLMFDPKLHVITMVAMLNARMPQAPDSRATMTSMLNFEHKMRSFNSFGVKTAVADGHYSFRPQDVTHLARLPDLDDIENHAGDTPNTHPGRASPIRQRGSDIEAAMSPPSLYANQSTASG